MILYACSINLDTYKVHRFTDEVDDYPSYESAEAAYADGERLGAAGYATFEGGEVYAESLVSQEDADRMVREKCGELANKFTIAMGKLV